MKQFSHEYIEPSISSGFKELDLKLKKKFTDPDTEAKLKFAVPECD